MVAMCAGTKGKIRRKIALQWSIDPINSMLVNPWIVDGIPRF